MRRRRYAQGKAYSSRCVYRHGGAECDGSREGVSEGTRSGYSERGHVGAGRQGQSRCAAGKCAGWLVAKSVCGFVS